MKLIRYRKPSLKTALGITKAKRHVSRATRIPMTKSGRKRKALNAFTGGFYGKYQRTRAAINRPLKRVKHPASCLGCLVNIVIVAALLTFAMIVSF